MEHKVEARLRVITGTVILIAFPAIMSGMSDKPFLIYFYTVFGTALLGGYLLITGITK